MANDDSFLRRFGINLAWFCADSYARDWVFGEDNDFDNSYDLVKDLRISHAELSYRLAVCDLASVARGIIQGDGTADATITFVMQEHCTEKSVQYKEILEKLYAKMRKDSFRDLTKLFVDWIDTVRESENAETTHDLRTYLPEDDSEEINTLLDTDTIREPESATTTHDLRTCLPEGDSEHEDESSEPEDDSEETSIPLDPHKMRKLVEFLKDSLTLLDTLQNENSVAEDTQLDFRESLVEKLHTIFWDETVNWADEPFSQLSTYGIGKDNDCASYLSSQTVEPRRMIASAISTPESVNDDRSFDISVAFNLLDARVISSKYWFERFTETISDYSTDTVSTEGLLQRFAFAVYQLMYCGFLVKSRRRDDAFEKAAMVWASSNR